MNILFLSINVPPGDKRDRITYNFIWKEMKYLSLRGHRVFYLADIDQDKEEDGIYFISKPSMLEKGSLPRRAKNLLFAIKNFKFLSTLLRMSVRNTLHICGIERALIKCIKKFNIDIIHTHFFEPSGEAAVLSSTHCGTPLVATLRGAELEKLPELDYGARLNNYYESALKKSIGRIDFFTAPNKLICEKLHREFGVPAYKIRHLPNGVENIELKKVNDEKNKQMNFISIGSMIKRKNFDILFKTIGRFNHQAEFLIVGSGPLKEKYVRIATEEGLKNVRFHHEMAKDKLFELISRCDCLIHPSLFEGMPNVVLEALAIGLPCLVSDIPAHREIIHEGYNGFLFDPRSADDLVRKIEFILDNRSMLLEMRQSCIKSASQYSIESKIEKYLEIYRRLLKKK